VKHPAVLLAALLLAACASLMTYRVGWLGYPLLPTVPAKAWKLSMQAHLKPDPRGITLKVGFPATEGNQMVMEETITSGSLNFTLERKAENQIGVWTGNPGPNGEVVGYQATVLIRRREASGNASPPLGPYPEGVSLDDRQLLGRIVSGWTALPVPQRIRTIGNVGAGELEGGAAPEEDVKAWPVFREKHGRVSSMLALFRAANFPARAAQGSCPRTAS
jgi:Inactive transglutaminase fused to 7 transmembrane helices